MGLVGCLVVWLFGVGTIENIFNNKINLLVYWVRKLQKFVNGKCVYPFEAECAYLAVGRLLSLLSYLIASYGETANDNSAASWGA